MPRPDSRSVAVVLVVATGCGSLTTYRTAEPIPRGRWQVDVAADVGVFADREQETRIPGGHVEVALRHGLGRATDATLKLYVPGVELGLQRRVATGRWQWAIAVAVGGERTTSGAGTTDAIHGHLRLTALATRRTSPAWAFTVGPIATAGLFVPAGGGHATGLLLGGFASVARTFARCWQVIPELSLHVTAAGEVPVRGTVVQVGAALGRRW